MDYILAQCDLIGQQHVDALPSGLDEEGLYRKPGVISKSNRLVKECIEKGKTDQTNLSDEFEWDTKTIAGAVKYYLSKHLGEPLFTFAMHQQFIDAASKYSVDGVLTPLFICLYNMCSQVDIPPQKSQTMRID